VFRSRFNNRLLFKSIAYPPTPFGDVDYDTSAKNETNHLILKALQVRKHPETEVFPNEYSLEGPPRGRVYEKFPFKFRVEKGKTYTFCCCGYSNTQVNI
jgi:hypothetical protein